MDFLLELSSHCNTNAGSGTVTVTLIHEPMKPNDGTVDTAGGSIDIQTSFPVTVGNMSCKCKMQCHFTEISTSILLSICCAKSFAQDCNYKLSIEVLDLHDGSPLMNAFVMINELDIGGTTDYDGGLVFENLCPKNVH